MEAAALEALTTAHAAVVAAKDAEITDLLYQRNGLAVTVVGIFSGSWLFVKAQLKQRDERLSHLNKRLNAYLPRGNDYAGE